MQEKILRTRFLICGSHATLNLLNAFCLSSCLRSPRLSIHSALQAEALESNCNWVSEPTLFAIILWTHFERVFCFCRSKVDSDSFFFFSMCPDILCSDSWCTCRRTVTWKTALYTASTDLFFSCWSTQGFVLQLHCEVILVCHQRRLILGFREDNKMWFVFSLMLKHYFPNSLIRASGYYFVSFCCPYCLFLALLLL